MSDADSCPPLSLTFSILQSSPTPIPPVRLYHVSLLLPSLPSVPLHPHATEALYLPTSFITPITLPPLPILTPVTIQLHRGSTSPSSPVYATVTVSVSTLLSALNSSLSFPLPRPTSSFSLVLNVEPVPTPSLHSATFYLASRALALTLPQKLLPSPSSLDLLLVVSRRRRDASWCPVYRSDTTCAPRISAPFFYPASAPHRTAVRLDVYRVSRRRRPFLLATLQCSLAYLTNALPDTSIALHPPISMLQPLTQACPLAGFLTIHGAATSAEHPHSAVQLGLVLFDRSRPLQSPIQDNTTLNLRRDAYASLPPLVPSTYQPSHSNPAPTASDPPTKTLIPAIFLARAAYRKSRRHTAQQQKPSSDPPTLRSLRAVFATVLPQKQLPSSHDVALDLIKRVERVPSADRVEPNAWT